MSERMVVAEGEEQQALDYARSAEAATAQLQDIPDNTAVRETSSVAVIGAGTMGGGIAMCFANAGIPVTLVETSAEGLQRGLDVMRGNYERSVSRGRYSQEQADAYLAAVSGTLDYADIGSVDLVVEAVFENMAVKKDVFASLDRHCKPGCILATNTSYLDINEIADATGRPADVVGAHFFSPANIMKLLEVVRGAKTAPDVVHTFMQLAKRIGKIPVAVGVCHGFVGNRMLRAYARQAQLLLLEGASPQQVDGVMEDWGMKMGPLAVGDLAGLDIGYRSRRDQGVESCSVAEFALADRLVEMDRLGQKTGAGYYLYDPKTRARQTDPQVQTLIESIASNFHVSRRELADEEILDRLLLALVNEGAEILRDGIAARPGDIDVVYLNGYGFPRARGGPMYQADRLGLPTVLERMESLRELTGDACWQPSPLLEELAQAGKSLADLDR